MNRPFGMSWFSVRALVGAETNWSATEFITIAMGLTLGGIGVLAGALADTAGGLRLRPGVLRTVFNLANVFLSIEIAVAVFRGLGGVTGGAWQSEAAGAAAGAAGWLVNYVLLFGAVSLAGRRHSMVAYLRSCLGVLPHSAGYGLGASGFALLHEQVGGAAMPALVVPVVLLQAVLVVHVREVSRARKAI